MSIYTKDIFSKSRYVIGEYTYGCPKIYDWNDGGNLIIGKFCSIAEGVTILLGGNHRYDWVTTYPFSAFANQWKGAEGVTGHPWSKGDVDIGNDVWIGFGSTILSGVKIGDGAVVAARSVVVGDVPEYAIVAGNPAKVVKYRFSDKKIKLLKKVKWWNWDYETIRSNIPLLCSTGVDYLHKKKRGRHSVKLLRQQI